MAKSEFLPPPWRRVLAGSLLLNPVFRPIATQVPPMVCVKLPRSVLVVFHLFRATELPNFQGLKS